MLEYRKGGAEKREFAARLQCPLCTQNLVGLCRSTLEFALFPHVHEPWSLIPFRQLCGVEGNSRKSSPATSSPFSCPSKASQFSWKSDLSARPAAAKSHSLALSPHIPTQPLHNKQTRKGWPVATAAAWESGGRVLGVILDGPQCAPLCNGTAQPHDPRTPGQLLVLEEPPQRKRSARH